jgi:SPP1 gp7 family putative phage head morphogenesis protein
MTRDDWQPSERIEGAYRESLKKLMNAFISIITPLDLASPEAILKALYDFYGSDFFKEQAYAAASRMITGLFHDGAKDWREAARMGMRGRMIHEGLLTEMRGPVGDRVRALITENARLITSFGQMRIGKGRNLTKQIVDFVQAEQMKGRRSSAIAWDLMRQYPKVAEGKINLIARTEVSKSATALTQARSESLGLNYYVWRSTKDGRVRPAHWLMNRVVVPWADPPAPEALRGVQSTLGEYHAGNCPNCRCYPEPLIRLDQVKWPCRVYHNDRLQPMTRVRFQRISGMEMQNAA